MIHAFPRLVEHRAVPQDGGGYVAETIWDVTFVHDSGAHLGTTTMLVSGVGEGNESWWDARRKAYRAASHLANHEQAMLGELVAP
jgi:hypothetical protein